MRREVWRTYKEKGKRRSVLYAAVTVVITAAACSGEVTDGDEPDVNRQLIAAAWANDVPLARDLILAGADVNFKDDTIQSAFLIAASEGHLELLELTLANGADVGSLDSFNGTALIRAAERGHAQVIERLLATGIDVDHVNNLGWTALHEAVIFGDGSERYAKTVELLLDHGADPALPTRGGQTPVLLARERDQMVIVELIRAALVEGT